MKVKELIEELQKLDQDCDVCLPDDWYGHSVMTKVSENEGKYYKDFSDESSERLQGKYVEIS